MEKRGRSLRPEERRHKSELNSLTEWSESIHFHLKKHPGPVRLILFSDDHPSSLCKKLLVPFITPCHTAVAFIFEECALCNVFFDLGIDS